ncbi:hypothetical protein KBA41_00645 [Candidatus Ozemobacteraceae bacterium]|nr:hypothetical protein [Candidatus Ozemobacteraceae bacterium]
MMRRPRRFQRILILVFALWLMVEPMAVTIAAAAEGPFTYPPRTDVSIDEQNPEEILQGMLYPNDYLKKILVATGATKEEMEKRILAELPLMLSAMYESLDEDGESYDIPTLYNAMQRIMDQTEVKDKVMNVVETARNVSFFVPWAVNQGIGPKSMQALKILKTDFDSIDAAVAGIEQVQELSLKSEGNTLAQAFRVSTSVEPVTKAEKIIDFMNKGSGVGLNVLGAVMSIGKIAGHDDWTLLTDGGEGKLTYDLAKELVGGALAIASLVAMLTPIGWIVSIATFVVTVITTTVDLAREYHTGYIKAYQESYGYMKTADTAFALQTPIGASTFQYYRQPGGRPIPDTWSDLMREANHAFTMANHAPSLSRFARKQWEGIARKLCERAALISHYDRFDPPQTWKKDPQAWTRMWESKASEMNSWWDPPSGKDDQEEHLERFFDDQNIARIENPGRWCYFCPDFFLYKLYNSKIFALRNEPNADRELADSPVFNLVGTRIQMVPFNYLLLLNELMQWESSNYLGTLPKFKTFVEQCFKVDLALVAVKEASLFAKYLETLKDQTESMLGAATEFLQRADAEASQISKEIEGLEYLLGGLAGNPEKVIEAAEWRRNVKAKLDWSWDTEEACTFRTAVERFSGKIRTKLAMHPFATMMSSAAMVMLAANAKRYKDLNVCMYALLEKYRKVKDSVQAGTYVEDLLLSGFLKTGKTPLLDYSGGFFTTGYVPLDHLRKNYEKAKSAYESWHEMVEDHVKILAHLTLAPKRARMQKLQRLVQLAEQHASDLFTPYFASDDKRIFLPPNDGTVEESGNTLPVDSRGLMYLLPPTDPLVLPENAFGTLK